VNRHLGAALLAALLAACSDNSSVQVATAKSPSGRAEAILTETNGGATTSFGYIVSLKGASPDGEPTPVASLYGATRNPQAYGANLVWLDGRTLEVQYLTAKTAKIERASVIVNGQTLTVRLRAGVVDKAAPAGGMEYNLPHQ
jgi:hypothetical protein